MMRTVLIVVIATLLAGCTATEPPTPRQRMADSEVAKRSITLAVGYLRQRDFAKAKDNLQKALQLDPRNPLALTTLGVTYQLEGELELADDQFRKAISSDPDFPQARNNYAGFLFAQERYAEAETHWRAAAADTFFQLRPQVFANLGRTYQQLGEPGKAEESFVRAVELNPSLPQALIALANIRYTQQNYMEAKFYHDRYDRVAQPSAASLWLCVRLSRVFQDKDREASCGLSLRNIFPATEEFRQYEASL